MATEPVFICEKQWTPGRWKVGGKEKGSMQEGQEGKNECGCAHLDAFVITTVRFLMVQIYKTDLIDRKRNIVLEWQYE